MNKVCSIMDTPRALLYLTIPLNDKNNCVTRASTQQQLFKQQQKATIGNKCITAEQCAPDANGFLCLLMDLGSGTLKIQSSSHPINDGQPHYFALNIHGNRGFVQVDHYHRPFALAGPIRETLDLVGGLCWGELRTSKQPPPHLSSEKSFRGSISNLILNFQPVVITAHILTSQDTFGVFLLNEKSEDEAASGCQKNNPCLNGGRCINGHHDDDDDSDDKDDDDDDDDDDRATFNARNADDDSDGGGESNGIYVRCDCSYTEFTGKHCEREVFLGTQKDKQQTLLACSDESS
ncbi:hypothetical protein HELRODRAFT_170114 [Helobdella robusta]|uniref:Laminin G domain-containing protein n=1 Tax=Helobdella robusta TaxID=6412 RepID=T1F2N3_HELRO|nr:hypothetical protein HELRODRAFT_170114 [Helobdella robusta]ESO07568.1 hypothetical protein HELRODRAFT_170114 [Helobdella robusta]